MKKVLILVIVIIIAAAGWFAWDHFFNQTEKVLTSSISAIPEDAKLIVEINNYDAFSKSLREENNFWTEIGSIPMFANMQTELNNLDTLLSKTKL